MTVAPDHSGPPPALAQAFLTIDLGALAANWKTLRARAAPAECAAVVKADAYGVGIEQATTTLLAAGCRTFFVAHASEGARVRAALGGSDAARIFGLNGLPCGDDVPSAYLALGLRPVIGSLEELAVWLAADRALFRALPFALHFDTGMNRRGIDPRDAARARDMIAAVGARPELLMSHFVSSEIDDDPLNRDQIDCFGHLRALFPGVPASLANSSGVYLGRPAHLDLVRPGYALYGGNPTPGQPNPMRPVVRLQAPILQVRSVEAGATVGYNAQWTAKRRTRLATIGVGYADGFPRAAMSTDQKPGAQAVIGGTICPLAGRVSMDLIVIDATDAPPQDVTPGALVELLGERITIDDLGARAQTIGYEILTGLGRRYHRRYLSA